MRALLESHGHTVSAVNSVAAAGEAIRQSRPDAILLHWTGRRTVRAFLQATTSSDNGHRTCAIVTAGADEIGDALDALEFGCDDCVLVPINEAEFLARLNASMRRKFGREEQAISTGPLLLDKKVHCLCVHGEPVTLAPTEFRLISFFLENPSRVFSRDEILKGAWQSRITAGSRTVDVHVRRLRQILEPYGCENMIQTVRSFGYRFRENANEL